jgi:hypothetical protein
MIGAYRIYPSWFTGRDRAFGDAQAAMSELAQRSASTMGRRVTGINIVATGQDHRGHYLDFDVTYSSTDRFEGAAR